MSKTAIRWEQARKVFLSPEWAVVVAAHVAAHPACAVCGFRATRAFPTSFEPVALSGKVPEVVVGLCAEDAALFFRYDRKPDIAALDQAVRHNKKIRQADAVATDSWR